MQEMEHNRVYSQACFWVLMLRACVLLSGKSWTLEGDGEQWEINCCSALPSEQKCIFKNSSAPAPAVHEVL